MGPDGDPVRSYIIDFSPRTLASERKELSSRQRFRARRFVERLRPIWEDNVDFSLGCGKEHYFDNSFSPCVLARKYKRSFVVYQKGHEKITSIAYYNMKNDCVVFYIARGSWYTPPVGSVAIIHDGSIHYDFLKVSLFALSSLLNFYSHIIAYFLSAFVTFYLSHLFLLP